MASNTISKWTPYGVALDITATTGAVTRTSATSYTVRLTVSWETYYSGAKTNYGMTATSGGVTKTISSFGTSRSSGSATFVGTYSISGNGSASKTISVSFRNYNSDNGNSSSKSIGLTVSVPAWTSYKVTYNANGGTGAPEAQTKWKDQTLTLSSTKPIRSGYGFKCWCPSANETSTKYSPGGSYTANASVTLYAIWNPNLYSVSFNANGGTGAPAQQTKTHGKTLVLSTTKPSRTGYDFLGWGTTSTATTVAYNSGGEYIDNKAITLYAIWKIKTYTVTYNANGGTTIPASQAKTYGQALTLSNIVPSRSGYVFKGWGTSPTSSVSFSPGGKYTTDANITLYAIWEVAYKKPTISNVKLIRCDGWGDPVGDGVEKTSARLDFEWSTFYPATSLVVSWKSNSGGISGSQPYDVSDSTMGWVIHFVFGDNEIPMDQTFTITISLSDSGGTTSLSYTLEGYVFPLDMLGGGNGIAFGRPAELEGIADFNFNIRSRKNVILDNNKLIRGLNTNGEETTMLYLSPSGHVVLGYGSYENKNGDTNVYGRDIIHYVSNIPNPGSYRPYLRKGDSFSIEIRTAGFVTHSSTMVCFFIPFAVPIVGNPIISISSNNGLIIRQDGKHTHGSDGANGTWAIPDSYTVSSFAYNGIGVIANFTNVTNAINNAQAGIHAKLIITLS